MSNDDDYCTLQVNDEDDINNITDRNDMSKN